MRIGFVISSLTQSITYISCLVSLGYEVIPIVVNNETVAVKNNGLSGVIEAIVDRKVLHIDELVLDEKVDAIIVMSDYNLVDAKYSSILKDGAPVILNINNYPNEFSSLFDYTNLHIITYSSQNIIENCNEVICSLEKVLKK